MTEQQKREAREAFEAWLREKYPMSDLERYPAESQWADQYAAHKTEWMWQAYLAATERVMGMVDSEIEENDNLRYDIGTLKASLDAEATARIAAESRIADLERELAASAKDAERYRWLRTRRRMDDEVVKPHGHLAVNQSFSTWGQTRYGDDADAAIDAAIAGAKP